MPLMSYGGTSAVSLLAGLGLVMAVSRTDPCMGIEGIAVSQRRVEAPHVTRNQPTLHGEPR
ncbi:hypothetical protein [Xanthomonas citri]|uniref:hypothetical protein n=1 Tax=Xanthomonas citri TaxID=346 RepID=UPI003CCFE5D4